MISKSILINKILDCDAAKFQRVCDAYFRANGYESIISYGLTAAGTKTKKGTPDSYSVDSFGNYTFFEYTTEQNNLKAKLESDVNKCIEKIKEINLDGKKDSKLIFVASSDNISPVDLDNSLNKCNKNNIKLEFINLNKFCDMLLENGRKVIYEEFGLKNTSPVCNLSEFIERNSNIYGSDFSKKIIGRENDIDNFKEIVDKNDAIIVFGEPGVGKTRLVVEYLKESKDKVIVVQNRGGNISQDLLLEIETDKKTIIFFDDANEISHLKIVLEDVFAQNTNIKIIFSVRNYAKASLNKIISQFKVSLVEYKVCELNSNYIKEIIEGNYQINNSKIVDRIIEIAKGNSRVVTIACEKMINENNLSFIWKDSASLLYDYYSEIIKKNDALKYDSNKKVLCIIATLKKIDLGNTDLVNMICTSIEIESSVFHNIINELNSLEILDVYEDRIVSISEQCLREFFMYDGYIKSKFLSLKKIINIFLNDYRIKIIDSVNSLISVYSSEKGNGLIKKELISLWDELESDDKINEQFIVSFCIIDPDRAIKWVKKRIFENQTKIKWKNCKENNTFDTYLEILEYIFPEEKDDKSLLTILDSLYYERYRKKSIGVIRRISSIKDNDIDNNFARQHKLLDVLLKVKNEDYFADIMVIVAEETLKFNYSTKMIDGNKFQSCSIEINDRVTNCFDLREKVWNIILLDVDKTHSYEVICNYFSDYSKDSNKLINKDLSYIERIIEKNNYNKYQELAIYCKSAPYVYQTKINWPFFTNKYKEELDDINLFIDPKDDELKESERKTIWESKIAKVAANDNLEEGKKRIQNAMKLYSNLFDNKAKVITFISYYIKYCNDIMLYWLLDGLERIVECFGTTIIYDIVKRDLNVDLIIEKINKIQSENLRNSIMACFINYSNIADSKIKGYCSEIINSNFADNNYEPKIKLTINRIHQIFDNKEFCLFVSYVSDNFSKKKLLCKSYYYELFKTTNFQINELTEIFKDDLNVLENAFLNYLSCYHFKYYSSTYYFALCDCDTNFFDSSLKQILSKRENLSALRELWIQKNRKIYATKIFDYLYTKKEQGIRLYFNFAGYFGLEFNQDDVDYNSVFEWAIEMTERDKDEKKYKYIMDVVAETNSENILKYLAYLINNGISDDIFKKLKTEKNCISYSGSVVFRYKDQIELYERLLNSINNRKQQEKIVSIIEDRIIKLKKIIVETKVQEYYEEDN